MTSKSLSFANRNQRFVVQEVNEPCTPLPVEDQPALDAVETNWLILRLTLSQFTDLYSSIRIGAEIFDPERAFEIEINFLQVVMCAQICEAIADECFADAEWIQQLIDSLIAGGLGGAGTGTSEPIGAIDAENIGGLAPGCNEAEKYGVAFEIANMINTVATDGFEAIETATNDAELLATILSSIPIINTIFGIAAETAVWLQDTVGENYAAAWNLSTHENMACAIYCEFDDCTLTMLDIRDAYRGVVSTLIPPSITSSFLDFVNWLITHTSGLSNNEIVGLVHLLICEVFVRGASWFGNVYRYIEIASQISAPISVPDCGCGTPACYFFGTSPQNQATLGIDNGDGTMSAVDGAFSTNPYRIGLVTNNFDDNVVFDFGAIVTGSVNRARVFPSGNQTGTPVYDGGYAGLVTASPIEGGSFSLDSNVDFTVNVDTGIEPC